MDLLKQTLEGIKPSFRDAELEAMKRLDNLAKPIGSLGKLEAIAAQLAGITGKVKNVIRKKCTIVMAADNGICAEGVSSCPQIITTTQSINFVKGITGIGVLSKHANADVRVIDIGIDNDVKYPGLIDRKIRKGTDNMAKGPAMSREEAVRAIETGIEIVGQLVHEGYDLLGTGEMGIGNTSTSSAVLMSFSGCSAEDAVGKGAGLTDEALGKKKRVITRVLEVNNPDKNDPIEVLYKVGGFDIAGLVGCFLGAAFYRVPIVIDGFISAASALIAYKLCPAVKDFMIPSHCSEEPGFLYAMKEIGLDPILNLNMRLGEGSGCPLAFNIIEAATAMINNMATFEEASIETDYLIDIRK